MSSHPHRHIPLPRLKDVTHIFEVQKTTVFDIITSELLSSPPLPAFLLTTIPGYI